MALELFGFRIGRKEEEQKLKDENLKSFVPPSVEDGAVEIASGGAYGTYVDLEGSAKSEAELVTRYRDCLLYTSPSPRDGLLSRMPSSA